MGNQNFINGMAFDQSGNLFGLDQYLYDIDPLTGVRTQIGTSTVGMGHRGLGIDYTSGELYAWTAGQNNAHDQLLRVDKATGESMEIELFGTLPSGGAVGVEFNPQNGDILAIRNGYALYSADVGSGEVSFVGNVTFNGELIGATSLAAQWPAAEPVPEPATMLLFGSGMVVLSRKIRRKS